jgi:uncharacterized protein (DUF433 family)
MADKRLTEDDVRTIYQALQEGESQPILAIEFGVTQQSVSAIRTGKAWSSVTGQILIPSKRAQLTVEDVEAIDDALRAGVSGRILAEDYAVSEQAISNIKCGRDWSWVTGRSPKRRKENRG